jgi:pimeloyl-ACP methyl ester carboxylesterase
MSESAVLPEPLTVQASPEALADLRARLRATRWPDAPEDAGWSLGTDLAYLRDLVTYWADGFDWAAQEKALSVFPRFRARIDGLGIHYVHARAVNPAGPVLPLVLCHGWPDSFWRYTKVIPLLTDPAAHGGDAADAFDVIVPDMPGYGYSDRPAGPPLDTIAIAGLWARLLDGLGYQRFGAVGGDIGAGVSSYLALNYPERVTAVHRMDAGVPAYSGDPADLTAEERGWMADMTAWSAAEGAYMAMHRTKPQTAAVGLTDSPAGLAAWIVEKMRAWSDCGGDISRSFTMDEILTNVTIYWLTETIGSSMRMYRANGEIPAAQQARRVEVPSGFTVFPANISRAPRAWLERTTNLVRFTEAPRGGHFAPFEDPEFYAAELRAFFRRYRA